MACLRSRAAVECVWPAGGAGAFEDYLRRLGVPGHAFGPATPVRKPRHLPERLIFRARRTQSEAVLAWRLLRRSDAATVLHCDLSPVTSFALLRWLSLFRPVCVTVHTPWTRPSGARERSWRAKLGTLLRCPRFELLAANEDARRSLAPYAEAGRLSRVPIAYSAFDGDEVESVRRDPLPRAELEARLGMPPGRFLVITAGQLIERKGYPILLAAARQLLERDDGFQFLWLATSAPSPEAQARLTAAALGRRFLVLEPAQMAASRRDLLRVMQAADAFVLPSLEEGLPLALVEALALERPVVATQVNAVPEAVVDEESGLLVPPGQVEPLVRALLALRADDGLRARLGRAGRARALDRFEQRRTAEVTWQAYVRAAAGRAGEA